MYKHFFKRFFDLSLSFFAIITLSIPMLLIAIVIKCDSRGPVLFKQKRIGKNKTPFMMLKFRTMSTDAPHDAPTHELANAQKWITKLGGFLRKTSLDELPQIFNIFIGQMSIIGPRPALCNQDDLVAERDKYGVNDIKPGLTGWAQINGRDILATSTKRKSEYDAYYLQHLSFWLDVKIFFLTIVKVLKSDGVVEGRADKSQHHDEESSGVLADEEVAVTESATIDILDNAENMKNVEVV